MDTSPEARAVETYVRALNVPGWSITFGKVRDDAGSTIVPTAFSKGAHMVRYDAYVWGPGRVGQMDPETAAIIAAAVAGERILRGEHAKPSRCGPERPGPDPV
jgi:hypothetical protein